MTETTATPVVVVGIDGSVEAANALGWAEEYVVTTAGSLRLVAAWEVPTMFGRPVPHEGFEPVEAAREVMAKAVANLTLPPDRVTQLVPVGRPGEVLVDVSRDADLLVVGRRGHRSSTRLLLGSTSAYCLHHAVVPVVVIN